MKKNSKWVLIITSVILAETRVILITNNINELAEVQSSSSKFGDF